MADKEGHKLGPKSFRAKQIHIYADCIKRYISFVSTYKKNVPGVSVNETKILKAYIQSSLKCDLTKPPYEEAWHECDNKLVDTSEMLLKRVNNSSPLRALVKGLCNQAIKNIRKGNNNLKLTEEQFSTLLESQRDIATKEQVQLMTHFYFLRVMYELYSPKDTRVFGDLVAKAFPKRKIDNKEREENDR